MTEWNVTFYSFFSGAKTEVTKAILINNLNYKQKEEYVESLKNKLLTISYVCTTADIWSANNKSYMGVTCHYLDDRLKRHSTVLACKRMKYSHTHLQIAKTLLNIHAAYN